MKIVIIILVALFVVQACRPKAPTNDEHYRSVSVDEAKTIMAQQNTRILDVRTPEEVQQGYIDGAYKFDVLAPGFEDSIKGLDKEKTYVVYCRSGGRSVKASNIMLKLGFKDVVNMEGGYTAWTK